MTRAACGPAEHQGKMAVGRYAAVFGFENEVDASKAATLIKKARRATTSSPVPSGRAREFVDCCGWRKSSWA
jgi:hypothetical protein